MSSNHFTIHNLPYGVVSLPGWRQPRLAIAYNDSAIDINDLILRHDNLTGSNAVRQSLDATTWNAFAALPAEARLDFRKQLKTTLESLSENDPALVPLSEVTMHLPFDSHNYSDFYCSYEHAKNCSDIFNLQIAAAWYQLPQVYNGRTSSLAVSGTPITRPCGIFPVATGSQATFQAENKLDFELEMGVWISNPVPRGHRLNIANAKSHIFGITLLNDWSARSIQFFEMAPLGPFHSKGSLTSISPWIVPIEALNEFASCARHSQQSPPPMRHLNWDATGNSEDQATWDVHVKCTVLRDGKEYVMSQSNLNELHWTPLQQVTHLASAGEGLSPGDVFGTGTISSARTNERGEKIGLSCIWERRLENARLSSLPKGIEETLLEDGDEVVMTAWVEDAKTGDIVFGFGECRGVVNPARQTEAWEVSTS